MNYEYVWIRKETGLEGQGNIRKYISKEAHSENEFCRMLYTLCGDDVRTLS
jgi:hypothetical protein